MGTILSINVSSEKGIVKDAVKSAKLIKGWGIENDAHAGDWERQISIFPVEALNKVPSEKYNEVMNGGYTENITISGLDLDKFSANSKVRIGDDVLIEVKFVGKDKLKEHGRPYIVSREGRFGIVLKGGIIPVNDNVYIVE